MKRYSIIFLALLLCALPCSAQQFDPEHRHSIEISSGIPPFHGFLLSGGSTSYRMGSGISTKEIVRPSLNLGYTYSINEKWDFNFVLNAVALFYKQYQYPAAKVTMEDGYVVDSYDWNAEPAFVGTQSKWWVSYNADFRWKWYRTDALRLYTAFGLGYVPGFPYFTPVLPYLAPIGINFGAKHLYGVAEFNVSPAATLLLIGAGYRF